MTYQQWLQQAIALLSPYTSTPRCEAEVLLSWVSGQSRTRLLAYGETLLTTHCVQQLSVLVQRRQQGEPIAYLVGQREFWSLPLQVTPVTLIPRPETEHLVEETLARLPTTPCELLELGTGSGAVALALAQERPDCQITATDCCPKAIAIAQYNAQQLARKNVTFLIGEWFTPVFQHQFSAIVSNPPYLDAADPHLQSGDLRFEPRQALVAEEGGLAALRHIIQQAGHYLLPGGWLLVEHGWQQGPAVFEWLQRAGYSQVATRCDLAQQPRVGIGQAATDLIFH
jgi:release factor glutamine methyltransferase